MKRLQFLWAYAKEWKRSLTAALLGLTFVSLTSLLYPWLLKLMVDQLSGSAPAPVSIPILSFALVVTFSLSTIIGYYQQVHLHRLGFRLRNSIRLAFYQSLLYHPMRFHRDVQVGELSSRATEDIGKLQPIFSNLVAPMYQNVLFASGCIILMSMLNVIATIFVLGLMALCLPVVLRLSRQLPELSAKSQRDHAYANAYLEETLVAIREIKAFVREKLELQRYSKVLCRALDTETHAAKLQVKINQAVYFLLSAVLLAIFYAGTSQTIFSNWTVGEVIAFYFYAYTLTMAVLSVGKAYLTYQGLAGALDRVMEILPAYAQGETPREGNLPAQISGTVEFDRVSFGYEAGKTVLRNISFSIDAGSWVLITGPSGSGKSTIANLLMGFYEAHSGSIRIDGIPIVEKTMFSLRQHIGYVGQDPFLIHGTLRENISFGLTSVDQEQIRHAIEISCLADVVKELPQGLNTIIGERGFNLSAGQKARVAIARALILDPAILILDEATTMIEEETEKLFWYNLESLRKEKTTIILGHHFENIPKIYETLKLSDGTIIPLGWKTLISHSRMTKSKANEVC